MRAADEALAIELGLGRRAKVVRLVARLAPFVLSALAHTSLALVGAGLSEPRAPRLLAFPPHADSLASERAAASIRVRRRALVEEARTARARGELSLGDFMLRANALDAEADGTALELAAVRAEYDRRLQALVAALRAAPPEIAIAEVFGDLAYTGTPGGRMADTLQTRRGSCEPVSHLVAAALFDAGLGHSTTLRFYGGAIAGVTHVTPVLSFGPEANPASLDLMTGRVPMAGGSAFPADELIEAYARAHGLSPRVVPARGSGPSSSRVGLLDERSVGPTRSLSSGYPANDDAFAGTLPLFADRAIAAATESSPEPRPEPPPCATYVSLAWLDLPSATVALRGGDVEAALVRTPTPFELERLSTRIQELETSPDGELASRLLRRACLAALYDHAGLLFALSGQPEVSARAGAEARRARREAAADLQAVESMDALEKTRALARLDELALSRAWVLLFLEGGDRVVRELAAQPRLRFARSTAIAAMMLAPATREDAIRIAEALPLDDQVDVMHELSHAHDHARPWAATYSLDLSRSPALVRGPFVAAYAVFRAMAWRLWDAARPPEEIVGALAREADAHALDQATRAAIALYLVKHVTRLYGPRPGGAEVIARAARALSERGLPGPAQLPPGPDLTVSERALLIRPTGRVLHGEPDR